MLLNIPITPAVLIDLAKQKSGLELQQMADELGYDKTRITKLKKGSCALSATEVKYYSSKAGLPFEATVGELEIARNPAAEVIWRETLKRAMLSLKQLHQWAKHRAFR